MGKNKNKKATAKVKRSPTASSVSSGSFAKNLVEQKFLDPELLASVGFDVSAHPPGTRFVQQTFASPMGTVKRSLFPVLWKKRFGPMQTVPEEVIQPKNTFYEERIRTLPSGQTLRSLVPFEGRLVYDNTNTGFSDIHVDPENPITSKVAWAQPRNTRHTFMTRRPYPVGIFPFRTENIEDLGPTSLVPVGVIAPPEPAPLMLRTSSQASDPRSPALSRSVSNVESPRPMNVSRNFSRNLRSRTSYPGTYVVVRRNNLSKKSKNRSGVSRAGAGAGVGTPVVPLANAYQAQGAVQGARVGFAPL